MARDLSDPYADQRDLKSQQRRQQSATPNRSAAISDGRMRFIRGLLRIEAGGRLEIEGTLEVDGDTTVTGTFTVTGPWSLDGDGNITGNVAVTGDITVSGGGKIIVDGSDPMQIGLTSAGRPGIQFGSGGQLVGTADGIQINNPSGNGFVYAGTSEVGMQRGSNSVEVSTSGTVTTGTATLSDDVYLLDLPNKTGTGLLVGLLWRDPANGKLYKITS